MEYLSLFLIGLSYGSTACMFSCMPFLSPLLLTQNGSSSALQAVSLFSLGRVFSYAFSALLAFFSAFALRSILDDQALAHGILGGSTLLVGVLLFYRSFRGAGCCGAEGGKTEKMGRIGLFGMGFAIALNPCTPVLSLAAVAAGAGSSSEAVAMGLIFGFGAVGVSWIVFGFLLSPVAREAVAQLARHRTVIERIAALLLMGVGINVIFSGTTF